jgi:hypothetical protein
MFFLFNLIFHPLRRAADFWNPASPKPARFLVRTAPGNSRQGLLEPADRLFSGCPEGQFLTVRAISQKIKK